jgi:hypothetical protein
VHIASSVVTGTAIVIDAEIVRTMTIMKHQCRFLAFGVVFCNCKFYEQQFLMAFNFPDSVAVPVIRNSE